MDKVLNAFKTAERMEVLCEGKVIVSAERGSAEYEKFFGLWSEMTRTALRMPAFGVSIDALTQENIKKGIWVKFYFEEVKCCDGMNFSALAVNVRPKDCGFNAERENGGKYQGRCYYIDLNGNTTEELYAALIGIDDNRLP